MTVRVASALDTGEDTGPAAVRAAARVAGELGGPCDLAVVFCSPHHRERAEVLSRAVRDELRPRTLIGCTGESVVGDGREVEETAGLSVWAAALPGVGLEPFHARFFRTESRAGFAGMPDFARRPDACAVLLLADPFSFPADALLRYGADRFPGLPFVGGMASGGHGPGQHALFHQDEVHDDGAVGVLLTGDVPLRTIVSQGCRPIGKPLVVTRAERNVIHELGGRPALQQLQESLDELSDLDRERASRGLHIGIVIDEYREDFGRGDFLIRGVFRADPQEGWIEVGDAVEVGRTVQFQIRDASSADEDLQAMLGQLGPPPAGGLLFTCNGRGSGMFVMPDHDVQAIHKVLGELPVAGLFCQGEIGPVGGRSFLHGFTASAAFFG